MTPGDSGVSPVPGVDELFAEISRLEGRPAAESEPGLLALLAHTDYRIRERAVRALSDRFSTRLARSAVEALSDDADAGRRAAGYELLRRGAGLSLPVLVESLSAPSADVRLAAAQLLAPFAREEALALLQAIASERDTNVRAALCIALGRSGRRGALAPLLAALSDDNVWTTVHALEGLGELGDAQAAPRLLPFLDRPSLRRGALKALTRIASGTVTEDLMRRAGGGENDTDLLTAAAASLAALPPGARARLASVWPAASARLSAILTESNASEGRRLAAARLMALLDLPGGPLEIVRAGGKAWEALADLRDARLPVALLAVLQADDAEAALVLVDRVRSRCLDAAFLSPLLVHSSPSVRGAVLAVLPPGTAPLPDILDILAAEDPETALPAALALAAAASLGGDASRPHAGALVDRAAGNDGPGRTAALVALSRVPGIPADGVVRGALGSEDPESRVAALAAAAGRAGIGEEEIRLRLDDGAAAVRAAALRALTERAIESGRESLSTSWRDVLVHLADDPQVAAAAGAAILALSGGDERIDLAADMLAQEDAVRRGALEALSRIADADAAEVVLPAVCHEDEETARAALVALRAARPAIRAEAAIRALGDRREGVREAAARLAATLSLEADAGLSPALAVALAVETGVAARTAILLALATVGDARCLASLSETLSQEKLPGAAQEAADALAVRHPEAVRQAWTTAPARAEGRWAAALARAARETGAQAP